MATKAKGKGPARNGSRAATRVGRYTPPEESGRYTKPIPKKDKQSPLWMGILIVALFVLGVLIVLLNYTHVLPGSVSNWYLVGAIASIFAGLMVATRYH